MGSVASQITRVSIIYSTVCSGADQRKHYSSTSLAFVRDIHQWQVNSPHKEPVTRKMFPCADVIMGWLASEPVMFYRNMDVSQQLTCDRRAIRSCVHWIKNAVGILWSCCCIVSLLPRLPVIGNHYHYWGTTHSLQSTYHSRRVSHDIYFWLPTHREWCVMYNLSLQHTNQDCTF